MALGLWCQHAPPGPGAALLEGGLCLLLLGISCLGCLALSLAGVSVSWQGCRGGSSHTVAWARFLSHRGVCLWSAPCCLPPAGLHRRGRVHAGARASVHWPPAEPPPSKHPACRLGHRRPCPRPWTLPGHEATVLGHRLVSDPARPAAPYLLVSRTKNRSPLSGRASEHQMPRRVPSAWLCAEGSG